MIGSIGIVTRKPIVPLAHRTQLEYVVRTPYSHNTVQYSTAVWYSTTMHCIESSTVVRTEVHDQLRKQAMGIKGSVGNPECRAETSKVFHTKYYRTVGGRGPVVTRTLSSDTEYMYGGRAAWSHQTALHSKYLYIRVSHSRVPRRRHFLKRSHQ